MADSRPSTPGPSRPPGESSEGTQGPGSRGVLMLVLLGLLLALGVVQYLLSAGPVDRISYSQLMRYFEEDRIASVAIAPTEIRGEYKADHVPGTDGEGDEDAADANAADANAAEERPTSFVVELGGIGTDGLADRFAEAGVEVDGDGLSAWETSWPTFLYIGLMLGFMFWLWRGLATRMSGSGPGGVLSFGRSRGKVIPESSVSVTFDDVAGADEAKQELQEIIEFLQRPEKFRRIGAKIPKGVLLVGPPGTGKTLMARAVAGEAGVPFISISGSEFVEMFVGVGAARVRDLFEQADKTAPCIVFIDELDALGRTRGGGGLPGGNEERESTLNQLLVEMDGFEGLEAVIIMAATNRPEVLDPALLRPGRFDRQVLIDRPDRVGREAILEVHAKGVKLADTVSLEELARRTPGFAGADLANLVNEAALLAARRDGEVVEMQDFSSALDRVIAGLEKKSRVMSDEERERIAYHEVGHALATHLSESDERIHKISIVPRGMGALGYTMQLPDQEKYLMTEPAIRTRLRGLLGGRAAEEVVFGEPSTGASNDLQKATDIARAMVMEYGMSDALGPVHLSRERRAVFLGERPGAGPSGHGDEVTNLLDREVRDIVSAALREAKTLLSDNRDSLETIARRLLELEQLEGDELDRLLADALVLHKGRAEPTAASAEE